MPWSLIKPQPTRDSPGSLLHGQVLLPTGLESGDAVDATHTKEILNAAKSILFSAFSHTKLFQDLITTIPQVIVVRLLTRDSTMDGAEASLPQLQTKYLEKKLQAKLMETASVNLNSELVGKWWLMEWVGTCHTWIILHQKPDQHGIGVMWSQEVGILGDTSLIAIQANLGHGFQTNQTEIAIDLHELSLNKHEKYHFSIFPLKYCDYCRIFLENKTILFIVWFLLKIMHWEPSFLLSTEFVLFIKKKN